MSLALGFGWLATACVVGLNLPQVWRSCVRRRTEGLPAARFWVAVLVSVVWLGYGLDGGGLVQVVLNTTTLVLNGALLAALPSYRREVGRWLPVVLGTALGVVALGASGGRQAVGVLGALVGTVLYLPQLLALLRGPRATDGISRATLWLQGAGGSCWIGYGVLRAETVVWVPNVFVLLTTGATLLLLAAREVDGPPQRGPLAPSRLGRTEVEWT